MKWFNWFSGSHIQYQTPKKEPEKKIQDLSLDERSLDERAKSLSGDIFSDIQDRMNCFRFHRAGLNADQAGRALVIARQIVEEVEEDYAARKRLGL